MNVMDQVRIGMQVIDSTGKAIGRVEDLRSGDPGAVTGAGQTSGGGGLLADVAAAFGGGADLHPQAAERLLRLGYLKIDQKGSFDGALHAEADRVSAVDEAQGAVDLSAAAEQLFRS